MFGRKNQKITEYQNTLIEQHVAEVENMYRKMRTWRHDYHNHMQVLTAYLEAGEVERARAFLDEINENLVKVDTVIKTGNTMVDAILNSKISLMTAKEIRVDATAHVPAALAVADVDLCVIIGNLLDNAMEACERLPAEGRFVRIYISVKGTHLYMSFTNAAGKKQMKVGNIFASTKGADHGFGLSRVDALVAQYGGYLTRASEDGGYTTEVILPIKLP
ncbi:MAG: GHKL domain-containing protein [Clostridia bacterium]|nr:GHKL domain-containing protein [Clostridia bacterium]